MVGIAVADRRRDVYCGFAPVTRFKARPSTLRWRDQRHIFIPMTENPLSTLARMDERSRSIFREIVETYLQTGEPVGSRTIARRGVSLSPASIRNVMSDLAELGLLDAPHASAGRLPTHAGLRVFVDGLLQVGELNSDERREIDARLVGSGEGRADNMLSEASELLSGLAGGAGLVFSPKHEAAVKHVEFVAISPQQALAIIVNEDDDVENRLLHLPAGLPSSALTEAGNYLNARMKGRTLPEAIDFVKKELSERRAALDAAAAGLVESGVAQWSGEDPTRGRSLIVRGRANLIEDAQAAEDLERVRDLFVELERKENLIQVLDGAQDGDGVRLFIGAENPLFSLSGSSMVVAPYMNAERKVIGALGVIGPTRLNYARVIPMVDYTAQAVGRLLDRRGLEGRKDEG